MGHLLLGVNNLAFFMALNCPNNSCRLSINSFFRSNIALRVIGITVLPVNQRTQAGLHPGVAFSQTWFPPIPCGESGKPVIN